MAFKVILIENVHQDLEEIYQYIANDSVEKATNWFNGCIDALDSLRESPKRCSKAPENEFFSEEIRQLIYGKYRILFSVSNNEVSVLHIRHGARPHLKNKQE